MFFGKWMRIELADNSEINDLQLTRFNKTARKSKISNWLGL
jgi:hypothetical protein